MKSFGPAVQQEMASKDFFIFLALVPFCSTEQNFSSRGAEPFWSILVQDLIRNISVKLFLTVSQQPGGDVL